MKEQQGFTLIELAVVLAIIAVLAGILTPMVTSYIDQARVSRATADAKTIVSSMNLYRRDTGYYPLYASLATAQAGTTNASALVSPGRIPSYTASIGWETILTSTALVVTALNTPLGGMSTNDPNPGKSSYRGPYIGALDTDPWGNEYVVTGNNLATGNLGFVISAGPDGVIETAVNQSAATFAAANDDIAIPLK